MPHNTDMHAVENCIKCVSNGTMKCMNKVKQPQQKRQLTFYTDGHYIEFQSFSEYKIKTLVKMEIHRSMHVVVGGIMRIWLCEVPRGEIAKSLR